MPDQALLEPVSDDSPCGDDLRWDPDFTALEQAFELATAADDDVVEGESEARADDSLQDVAWSARQLCRRTKDMRVLAIVAEAAWRHGGLVAFADAVTDIVAVVETWSDPDAGFHPRADEEDGDLSERNAPLTKLVGRIPMLVEVTGWGGSLPPAAQQEETRNALAAVFEAWTTRLEPAFGRDLVSPGEAWGAIRRLVGEAVPAAAGDPAGDGPGASQGASAVAPAVADAWDALEHALQLMRLQNGHSPAIPVLRLVTTWREADIISIAEDLRDAGVTLEQLLEAIKKRLDAG